MMETIMKMKTTDSCSENKYENGNKNDNESRSKNKVKSATLIHIFYHYLRAVNV